MECVMPHEKQMSDAELAAFEAGQDFEALLVQSVREMSGGKTREVRVIALDRKALRHAPDAKATQIKT
jgi:hypothetical protein